MTTLYIIDIYYDGGRRWQAVTSASDREAALVSATLKWRDQHPTSTFERLVIA